MNLIDRLKSVFSGVSRGTELAPESNIQNSFTSLSELNALLEEQRRMGRIKSEQLAIGRQLKGEIESLDKQRVELLTEALVSDDQEKSAEASAMAEAISQKQRKLDDIEQVVSGIAGKIDALNNRREELRRVYLRDLGYFLNGIFKELAAEYDQKAGPLAELILQISALQQIMMLYKTGDSNGFNRRVYLPKIEPGSAMIRESILDGDSAAFRNSAAGFQKSIQDQMVAAGFNFRFD